MVAYSFSLCDLIVSKLSNESASQGLNLGQSRRSIDNPTPYPVSELADIPSLRDIPGEITAVHPW